MFLLSGQQGVLQHASSHWSEFSKATNVAFNAAVMAKSADAECSQPTQEHAARLQCTAYAVLAAALPMLVVLWLIHTRRRCFPHAGFHAGAPVLPVAVCSRDPPIHL